MMMMMIIGTTVAAVVGKLEMNSLAYMYVCILNAYFWESIQNILEIKHRTIHHNRQCESQNDGIYLYFSLSLYISLSVKNII